MKELAEQCMAIAQVFVLWSSTQQCSKQGIHNKQYGWAIRKEISLFHLTVELQSKGMTDTRSALGWFGCYGIEALKGMRLLLNLQ